MADLKILIQGQLQEKETEKTIKSQLEQIQKNLKISIGTDEKQINDIAKQVKKLQDQLKNSNVSIIKNEDTVKIKKLETDFKKVLIEAEKLGQVSISKTFDPATKELQQFILTLNKADGTVEKLKYRLAELDNIKGLDNSFYLKGQQSTDKTLLDMAKAREKANQKRLQDEQKLTENQAKAINKNIELIQKEKKAQEELNKKRAKEIEDLEHSVRLFQERQKLQVSGLVSRHGNNVDNNALEKYMNGLNNIPLDNVDLANKKMSELVLGYKSLSTHARIASKDSLDFGNMLSQAMTKFPIWMIASTA